MFVSDIVYSYMSRVLNHTHPDVYGSMFSNYLKRDKYNNYNNTLFKEGNSVP